MSGSPPAQHRQDGASTNGAGGAEVVNMLHLLSSCCYAAERGMLAIRRENKSREKTKFEVLQTKSEGDDKSVVTRADHAGQAAIFSYLRSIPSIGNKLNLVGEEEESIGEAILKPQQGKADSSVEQKVEFVSAPHPACEELIMGFEGNATEPTTTNPDHQQLLARPVPLKAVTIFVDPLDGTREFVDNRLQNVETLIGIALNGRPVAGVIGLPFWKKESIELVDGGTAVGEESTSGRSRATVLTPEQEILAREGGNVGLSQGTSNGHTSLNHKEEVPPPLVCGLVGVGVAGLGTIDKERFQKRQAADTTSTTTIAGDQSESTFILAASNDSVAPLKAVRNSLCDPQSAGGGFKNFSVSG
ncbi:unnamed protein product, partial [Amoebophrya sp. A25]|eukprot:GSA25T00023193001.1